MKKRKLPDDPLERFIYCEEQEKKAHRRFEKASDEIIETQTRIIKVNERAAKIGNMLIESGKKRWKDSNKENRELRELYQQAAERCYWSKNRHLSCLAIEEAMKDDLRKLSKKWDDNHPLSDLLQKLSDNERDIKKIDIRRKIRNPFKGK